MLRQRDKCLPAPVLAPVSQELEGEEQDSLTQPLPEDEEPEEESDPLDWLPWEKVLDRLREIMGARAVEAFLGRVQLTAGDDGMLLIGIGSPIAREWMAECHYRDVQQAIQDVTGRRPPLAFIGAKCGGFYHEEGRGF